MKGLANRIRDDLNNKDFVLLYAYNGTGKTCLSMEVKKQNQANQKIKIEIHKKEEKKPN